jgi:hypothetical protein
MNRLLKKVAKFALMLAPVGLLSQCDVLDETLPVWQLDLLGPLAKTSISVEEVSDFGDFSYSSSATASSMGFPNGVVIPPISTNRTLGPFTASTNEYTQVNFTSGTIGIAFTNNMPANIQAGSKLVIESGGAVLASIDLPAVPARGSFSNSNIANLAGKSMTGTISVRVEGYKTSGSGTTTIKSTDGFSFTFNITNAAISSIKITNNKSFSASSGLTEFSLVGEEVPIKEVTGDMILNVSNGIPVVFSIQVDFYNEQKQKVASLFSNAQTIAAATVDNDGKPVKATSSRLVGSIDAAMFQKIRDAKYISTKASASSLSGAPAVLLSLTDKMDIQIIGDLKVSINE